MAGRPRKPAALHDLEGTARKHITDQRKAELLLTAKEGSIGDPPEYLNPAAKAHWIKLRAFTQYDQVLCPAFIDTLAEYCSLQVRHEQDCRTRNHNKNGTMNMRNEDYRRLHSLRMQLGLTPASQSKVILRNNQQKPIASKWTRVA